MAYSRKQVISKAEAVREFRLPRHQVEYVIKKFGIAPVAARGVPAGHYRWYPRKLVANALFLQHPQITQAS